jgi:hypothetical protein
MMSIAIGYRKHWRLLIRRILLFNQRGWNRGEIQRGGGEIIQQSEEPMRIGK